MMRERRGSVMLYTALAMPVFIGATALGIEIPHWTGAKLDCQIAADASARAGAIFLANNPTLANRNRLAREQACNLASVNGYPDCEARLTFGNVSVTVSKSVPLFFAAAIFNRSTLTLSATAIAAIDLSTTLPTVKLIQ